jgi:hypothetical protein
VLTELEVRVDDWVCSIVESGTEIVGAARGVLTNTVAAFDVAVTPALSVTWSSKYQVPVAVRVPLGVEGVEVVVQVKELAPGRGVKTVAVGDSSNHWHV